MKLIPAVAVAAQVLLGNLCFMPMAFAGEAMPMDHDMQEMEQVTEMITTPVNAMSPLHCDGCMTITRPKHYASAMGGDRMPCNNGHCLVEHTPSLATISESPQKDALKTTILPAAIFYTEPLNDSIRSGWHERPPLQVSLTRTVVLRE